MRFAWIIGLLFSGVLASNAQGNYQLQLKTDDKLSAHSFSYWGEVKIKSADTSFYYALHSTEPDVINLAKPGTYTVTCTSVFGDRITKTMKIKKAKTKLKLKGMSNWYKPSPKLINLSERMKNNDTLFIIHSTGYPAFSYEKLGVAKKDGKYYAIQYQGLTTDIFQTMQVTEGQFQEVVKFEMLSKELKPSPNCTQPEIYTLELNKESYSFTDNSCSWDGFNNIKAVLLRVEQ